MTQINEVPIGGIMLMKPEVKVIKDYCKSRCKAFNLDTDVMNDCVASLTEDERKILRAENYESSAFIFVANKVFNRHNDVCNGVTTIVKNGTQYTAEITTESSISELDISLKTLTDCNRSCIYHIGDVDKEILPTLSFEAIADLTSAIILHEAIVTNGSSTVTTVHTRDNNRAVEQSLNKE